MFCLPDCINDVSCFANAASTHFCATSSRHLVSVHLSDTHKEDQTRLKQYLPRVNVLIKDIIALHEEPGRRVRFERETNTMNHNGDSAVGPKTAAAAISIAGGFSLYQYAPAYLLFGSGIATVITLFVLQVLVLLTYKIVIYPNYLSPLRHLPSPPVSFCIVDDLLVLFLPYHRVPASLMATLPRS